MDEDSTPFELTAPACHLMDLETAARSFGVTRQAFHRWNVTPVRIEGTRRLFDFASVIENRLQAAQDAATPADAEIDRLQARIDLLREQIEAQRLRNAEAEAEYIPAGGAAAALGALMTGVAGVLRHIPGDLLTEFPNLEPAGDNIGREIGRAIERIRAAAIETGDPESEH